MKGTGAGEDRTSDFLVLPCWKCSGRGGEKAALPFRGIGDAQTTVARAKRPSQEQRSEGHPLSPNLVKGGSAFT